MKKSIFFVLCLSVVIGAAQCDESTNDDGSNDGTNDSSDLSAAEVASGGCNEEQGDVNEDECEGIDEYMECVETECGYGYAECLGDGYEDGDFSGAPCEEHMTCVMESDDTCDNDCQLDPQSECGECFVDMGMCAYQNCFSLIKCGETTEGGACSQVDACCASAGELMQMACELQAGAAKSSGDEACQVVLDSYCS